MKLLNESMPAQAYPNMKYEMYLYGMQTVHVEQGWTCQRHLHPLMLEINLVLKGCQSAVVHSRSYEQQAGDLLLIPPMQLHEYAAVHSADLRYLVLHVQISDPALLALLAQTDEVFFPAGHELNTRLKPLLDELLRLLLEAASRIGVFAKLLEIMGELERYGGSRPSALAPSPAEALAYRIAREIDRLILPADDSEPPFKANWLETIAREQGISRRHCARIFQQVYRMPPREYLSILRRQEAMQRLAEGSEPLEAIGSRIGFENVQSFIRQFTKWTGTTPGAYRKRQRNSVAFLTPLGPD